ncbi:MAG: hypothetical protein HKL96_09720 [Phycisphaerales bacterium]|nr:hypothetical protein [Phycisphaerales bacterium]
MNVLGLVQLVDAPSAGGGYPFCFGIERRAACGDLSRPSDVLNLVQRLLKLFIGPCDGIAAGCAFRAARSSEFQGLGELCQKLSAASPPAMSLASLHMGRRLWELSRRWDWSHPVHDQLDPMAACVDLHHAVAFGSLVSETTANPVRAVAACLLQAARGIINTAVAAASFDDSIGRQLLWEVQPAISDIARQYAECSPHDIATLATDTELSNGF